MPKTRINCPNCRQPIVVDINQLFDVGTNPTAKQALLSGIANVIQCPLCGFQGAAATPIVYHDPGKELLMTYFPPELSLPLNEQERTIGPLINQVMNSLPQEKRKAYLLRPQSVLTMQGLIERILEADGITREMIQAQQQRLNLLQRLVNASDEVIEEVAKHEDALIDAEFYGLINRLIDTAAASNDQESAQRLSELIQKLIPLTSFGRELQEQSKEVEEAVKSLRALGQELTRDKLLDLVVKSPNDVRLRAYVSMARPGMDYSFFQLLSERIDRARADGRTRLIEIREKLLAYTQEYDTQIQARADQARRLLDTLLKTENVTEATLQNLQAIDEYFLQIVNEQMDLARKSGDLERISKLQQVIEALKQVSSVPPEFALIEEMLEAQDEAKLRSLLEQHRQEITPEFMDALTSLMTQTQSGQDPELSQKLQVVYRTALRFSMQTNLSK